MRALIEAGADINKATDNGRTPLLFAAQENHEAVVRALIEAGADVNKARGDGVTPLLFAAYTGHEAVVRALIKAGADVNAVGDYRTPLSVAMTRVVNVAQGNHAAIVQLIRDAGAV